MTLANDAAHTLKAGEIMLAATDTLTLKSAARSMHKARPGMPATYETVGNGAFVRAASTTAGFTRSGSPDRSQGTLIGEAGSTVTAADSITLDATLANDYQGTATFAKNGVAVAGNLAVGATRGEFWRGADWRRRHHLQSG